MDWRAHISLDPEVLVGKPVIKGTRISVEFLLELLAAGWTIDEILKSYPHITKDDVLAAIKHAAETLKEVQFIPLPEVSQG